MSLKELIKTITREELTFVLKITFLTVIITSSPYLLGFFTAGKDHYYPLTPNLNFVDYHNYFSYIEQARQGHFVFKDLYTSEEQPPVIVNVFFLFLGLLAKFLNLEAPIIFQLARILLIFIFSFIAFLFICYFFTEKKKREICFIFLLFSSGLGRLVGNLAPFPHKSLSLDLWVPEAITFLTLYTNTLFIASLTLIIIIFLLMLLAKENNNIFYALGAGFFALLLFQFHPYHIPTIFTVLGTFLIYLSLKQKRIDWQFFFYYLILFFVSLPSLFYYFFLFYFHSLTIERIRQALPVGFTPSLPHLISAYGFLFILAFIGVFQSIKQKGDRFSFLVVWFFSQMVLIYSPLPLQRRLTEGLHVVITILAIIGIFTLYNFLKGKITYQKFLKFFGPSLKFFFISLFVLFFGLSNLAIISNDILLILKKELFFDKEKKEAMQWLKRNTREDDIILANPYWNGNFIPGIAVRRVYIGHGVETAYSSIKEKELRWFFKDNENDSKKYQFLKKKGIDYLFYSDEEMALGQFNPEQKHYLKKVFEQRGVTIYQVVY